MKKIPDYPNYYATKTGKIYSWFGSLRHPKPKKPKLLSQWERHGYYSVSLRKKNKDIKEYVHRLILITYVGKPKKGQQCRHLDGNRKKNKLNNLCWGTPKENQTDRNIHNTHNKGERHPRCKLTEKKVLEINRLGKNVAFKEAGGNYKIIAKKYNISLSMVGKIVRQKSWKHLFITPQQG